MKLINWWRGVLHYCTFPLEMIESEDNEENEVQDSTKTKETR